MVRKTSKSFFLFYFLWYYLLHHTLCGDAREEDFNEFIYSFIILLSLKVTLIYQRYT